MSFGFLRRITIVISQSSTRSPILDDLAIWRRALDADEILELMEEGLSTSPPPAVFRRGDKNADGAVNIADAIVLLGFLFGGGEILVCQDAADTNDDGQLNIADAIATPSHLFGGAGDLPPPGTTACGPDPTEDELPACVYPRERCEP